LRHKGMSISGRKINGPTFRTNNSKVWRGIGERGETYHGVKGNASCATGHVARPSAKSPQEMQKLARGIRTFG